MKKAIDVLLFSGLIIALSACSENTRNKMSDDIKEAKQAVGIVTNQIADDTKEAWSMLKDSVKDSWNDAESELHKKGDETAINRENVVDKALSEIDEVVSSILETKDAIEQDVTHTNQNVEKVAAGAKDKLNEVKDLKTGVAQVADSIKNSL